MSTKQKLPDFVGSYPPEHEELLRKVGLIRDEMYIVTAVRNTLKLQKSDNGILFKEVEVEAGGATAGMLKTAAAPAKNNRGFIAGDWRTGLNAEQKRIIYEECGVPYAMIAEKTPMGEYLPDTTYEVYTGKVYDLRDPVQTAEFRYLWYANNGTVGRDEDDARQLDYPYYFLSIDLLHKDRKTEVEVRKSALRLTELSTEKKIQLLKLCLYESGGIGELNTGASIDDYTTEWDSICMEDARLAIRTAELTMPHDRLMVYTLVHYGFLTRSHSAIYGKDNNNKDVCLGETFDLAVTHIRDERQYGHYHRQYKNIVSSGIESGLVVPNIQAEAVAPIITTATVEVNDLEAVRVKLGTANKLVMTKWNSTYNLGVTIPEEATAADIRPMMVAALDHKIATLLNN